MLILGIETATEQVGVAIGGHEGVIATFEVARGRRHAETLTPAIEFVCRQSGIELCEIGCVAVDVGPGLFTGMSRDSFCSMSRFRTSMPGCGSRCAPRSAASSANLA